MVINNRSLTVQINFGRTHSFVYEVTVMETRYQDIHSNPIRVTVDGGNYMYSSSTCPKFIWKMGGKTFKEDLRVLNLGG